MDKSALDILVRISCITENVVMDKVAVGGVRSIAATVTSTVGAEVVMDRDVNGIGRLVCRVGEKVFMDNV